jgi:uncharacterized protein
MVARILENTLKKKLFSQKIIVLLGPRQSGKTTLIRQLAAGSDENYLYLNGDLHTVEEQLSQANREVLATAIGNHRVVVIDEAQRIKNIGLVLKILADQFTEKQILVTGSSALELAAGINEPLTGRKWEYTLYPLSWQELVQHFPYLTALDQLPLRLIYGSYPDVINHPGSEKEVLQNLAGSYLYKDLLNYEGIRKPELLLKLLQALALQVGQEVSYNELAQITGVSKNTVETYIGLLEKTYVIFRLRPFSRNLRNEINTSRKIYFYDNGILNALTGNFNMPGLRNDMGALWENFLISERKKLLTYNGFHGRTYFWRTAQQSEIDYIEEINGQLYAFECKWGEKTKTHFSKTFVNAYTPAITQVIRPSGFSEWLTKYPY